MAGDLCSWWDTKGVRVVVCGAGGVSFGLDEETRGRALSLSVLYVRLCLRLGLFWQLEKEGGVWMVAWLNAPRTCFEVDYSEI